MPAWYEPDASQPLDPTAWIARCHDQGADAVLLDEGALPPAFFDLSTGVAGELLQKLANYGIRLAAVVADPSGHSAPFQDFVRESRRSRAHRFFATRDAAIAWLES